MLDLSLRHGDIDFLVYEDTRYSLDRHYRIVSTLAQRLLDAGVTKGDRVAIAARNLPEWVMAFWASSIAGSVVTPLNAWWTTDELVYGLEDSGASVLFVDEERLERVRDHLDELSTDDGRRHERRAGRAARLGRAMTRVRVVDFHDFLGDVDPAATPPDVDMQPDDDVTMLYTSGTTGHPKGAVGSHRNAITNFMNLAFSAQRFALRFRDPADATPAAQNSGLVNIPLLSRDGLTRVPRAEHCCGREDRDDAPLRRAARTENHRGRTHHQLRRRADHRHANHRSPRLRPVRHLEHEEHLLRRCAGAAGARCSPGRQVPGRPPRTTATA